MASIGELFIELGVKADTQTINKVGDGIKNLRKNALLLTGAFTGAVIGLDRFVNSALKGVVALQNINAQTGLSIQKLQQFQQAGQLSNLAISAEQIANSIANVQKNIAQIKIGQGDIAPFQLLGVDVAGQDAFGVIEQLRGAIQGLDPAIATNLISQIGLTPDFINILKLSRKEFELLGENTFLNPRQRADIDKVGTSIKALSLRFKALKDQAVAKIAPQLNELVQNFFKWLKDNGDKVVRVITSMARGFAAFASAVGNAFTLTARFIENIVGMENGIKTLAIAFGALTLSFSPFLLGLAAIILLLDDIAVFRRGGKSVIGDLVEAFEDLPDFAKALGGLAVGGTIAASLSGITKGIIAMTAPALALAAPLASIVASLALLSKAPEIGKKVAGAVEESGFGKKFFEFLDKRALEGVLGEKGLEFARSSQGQAIINNNITNNVNGVQNPEVISSELNRVQRSVTQESLNRTQATQGNGVR